jgi:hypothetical protein
MKLTWDSIAALNLALSVLILALGIRAARQGKGATPLWIGIAFGLFALSHLAELLGLKQSFTEVLVIIRTLGYLLIVFIQYKLAGAPPVKAEDLPEKS